jgi:hypothetical protein
MFHYFEKMKIGSCNLHAVCVSVYPPINFRMAEPIFMKLGIYMMAPEPITMAYFMKISHQSVCLYVYLPVVARQWLGKNHPVIVKQQLGKNVTTANEYAHNSRRIVGRVIFYAAQVVS